MAKEYIKRELGGEKIRIVGTQWRWNLIEMASHSEALTFGDCFVFFPKFPNHRVDQPIANCLPMINHFGRSFSNFLHFE